MNNFGSRKGRAEEERLLSQARPYMLRGKSPDGDAIWNRTLWTLTHVSNFKVEAGAIQVTVRL